MSFPAGKLSQPQEHTLSTHSLDITPKRRTPPEQNSFLLVYFTESKKEIALEFKVRTIDRF